MDWSHGNERAGRRSLCQPIPRPAHQPEHAADSRIRCRLHTKVPQLDSVMSRRLQAFGKERDRLLSMRNFTLCAEAATPARVRPRRHREAIRECPRRSGPDAQRGSRRLSSGEDGAARVRGVSWRNHLAPDRSRGRFRFTGSAELAQVVDDTVSVCRGSTRGEDSVRPDEREAAA